MEVICLLLFEEKMLMSLLEKSALFIPYLAKNCLENKWNCQGDISSLDAVIGFSFSLPNFWKKIKFKKSFLFARSLIKYFEISFPLAIYLLSNSWKMSCWNIEKVRMIFLPVPISIWFNLFWKCWSCCAILVYENKYFLNPS